MNAWSVLSDDLRQIQADSATRKTRNLLQLFMTRARRKFYIHFVPVVFVRLAF